MALLFLLGVASDAAASGRNIKLLSSNPQNYVYLIGSNIAISGIVVDDQANPLSGIQVLAEDPIVRQSRFVGQPTDAGGHFTLSYSSSQTGNPGFFVVQLSTDGSVFTPVGITLNKPAVLSGAVPGLNLPIGQFSSLSTASADARTLGFQNESTPAYILPSASDQKTTGMTIGNSMAAWLVGQGKDYIKDPSNDVALGLLPTCLAGGPVNPVCDFAVSYTLTSLAHQVVKADIDLIIDRAPNLNDGQRLGAHQLVTGADLLWSATHFSSKGGIDTAVDILSASWSIQDASLQLLTDSSGNVTGLVGVGIGTGNQGARCVVVTQATVTSPQAPSAPSNLSATNMSGQIQLYWSNNGTGSTGVKIDRKTGSNGSWSQLAQVSATTSAFLNTSVSPSTTYYYRVSAYNSAASSGYSNTANATTSPATTQVVRTLTVNSSNPASGVYIYIGPNATNGVADGVTPFGRNYYAGTSVTANAPASAGANNFQKWQLDGVDFSTSLVTTVAMNANHSLTAIYSPQAPGCSYSLNPTSYAFPSGGGNDAFNVICGSGCPWTATSSDSWITLTGQTSGMGTKGISYSVAANNNTNSRTGSINVAGRTFTISQNGSVSTCTYSLSPRTYTFPSGGGTDSFNVVCSTGCPWSATSPDAWITLTGPTSGSGTTGISFSVAANPNTTSRGGRIFVEGQIFTVNQNGNTGACSYSLRESSTIWPSAGGHGAVDILCGQGCPWTATSTVPWITMDAPASASGPYGIGYTIDANTSTNSRSGSITVAGLTYSIVQNAQAPGGPPADNVLGQATFTSRLNPNPPTASSMFQPTDVAVDPTTGKVFVADTSNNRVLRFSSAAAMTNGAAAEAVLGQPTFTTKAVSTTQSGMNGVNGLTVDNAGILWVGDYLNNRVLRFNSAASKATGANADGVLGQPNFTSSAENTTQSGMIAPSGVFVDGTGALWVADKTNHRILRFNSAATKPNGANADAVLGQSNFTGNAYGLSQAKFHYPSDVAVDAAGTLWVADQNNCRILRFDAAASKPNGANADGVLGQADFNTANRICTRASMTDPSGVLMGSHGSIWAVDSSNLRVLRYDGASSKSNGSPADGLLGQPDFTTKTYNTTQTGFGFPITGCIDSAGNLFVADFTNERVLRFNQQDIVRTADIALQISPAAGGNVAGGGTFPIGNSQQIAALPVPGWEFVTWSDGVAQSSRTITVPAGGATYSAIFTPLPVYSVSPSAGSSGSITPSTVQSVNEGENITFSALPGNGYVVDQWRLNGAAVQSGGDGFTIGNVSANASVEVIFKPSPQTAFAQWSAAHFTFAQLNDPNVSGWTADPDFDGIANGLEFLFNSSPTDGTQPAQDARPQVGMETFGSITYLTLTYRKSTQADSSIVHVQVSPNLSAGSWQDVVPDMIDGLMPDPVTGDPRIKVKVNVTGDVKKFIRLKVDAQ